MFFHGSGSAGKKIRIRIRPEIEMKKKIYLYFRKVGITFDILTHHFMLESVDSGLYFVQDENNFYKAVVTGRIRIRMAKNQRIRPDPDPHPCDYECGYFSAEVYSEGGG